MHHVEDEIKDLPERLIAFKTAFCDRQMGLTMRGELRLGYCHGNGDIVLLVVVNCIRIAAPQYTITEPKSLTEFIGCLYSVKTR